MLDHNLESEDETEDDLASTYLTFDLGGQTLGLEVRYVREILDCQEITRLPSAPMDIQGIVDVRGISVPILDLKSRLGVPDAGLSDEARIVVLEFGMRKDPVGILADRVQKVDVIPENEIETVPSAGLANWDTSNLRGLSRRSEGLVVLLDIARIFSSADCDTGLF